MRKLRSIMSGSVHFTLRDSETDKLKLNRLTLAFSGHHSNLEEAFLADYNRRSLKPMRFSLLLAIVFFDLFAILDVMLFPELKPLFWFIRFGIITPALLAVILFSFRPVFKRYMQVILASSMYGGGIAIVIMTVLATNQAGNYTYYAGLILIFIFGYTFIRARFIYATVAGWFIVATYEVAALWFSETPLEIQINNHFFFVSANIIGMFIAYFLEKSARGDFYMRILLEKEQENVKAANNQLEKRVQQRTRQLSKSNEELLNEIETRKLHQKEKAELESQLMQLQKMETIGTLAGGIAHDFNNILTPIIGYTEMALEELPDQSQIREDIEQVNVAAFRGKDLVEQILAFSRQMDIEKKPLHLDVIVQEVMKLMRASLPADIEILEELEANVGTVLADATQMHQIIMNLCTNAAHAMKKGGGELLVKLDEIELKSKSVKGTQKIKKGIYVRLTVSDTGHGMDQLTMERIFEPFFTRKDVGSGSGLGLSVVHGIVNSCKGTILVESQVGEGSKFMIYLPRHSMSHVDAKAESLNPEK